MATKGKKKTPPKRKPVIPTDEHLEARRRRVHELWALSDRLIARALIKEGFFETPANSRVAFDAAQFEESCRRTISNDRAAIREELRKPRNLTAADRTEATEDYVARLQARIDMISERLATTTVKDTAYAQLMETLLRYEAAIAKARGSDEAPELPADDDQSASVPFLGIVVGINNLTPEAKKRINEWSGGGK